MFGVNEIICYQSYDGEIFKTREEAEAHNKESSENVLTFDEFYMYDENGSIIIQADGSIPNYDDVCFFYAKTDRGAEFLKKYLSEYYDDEIDIEPKMLYRYNIYKCAWVSQKKCLDDFNSLWKGIITFEQAHC